MTEQPVYEEKVSSARTEALFLALTFVFLSLLTWRLRVGGGGLLTIVFLFLVILFLFPSLNYRTLIIRLSSESLVLKFGIFQWNVELDNIEACHLDDVSLWRIGGAGMHFTFIRRKYRAFLNFLEHPRVVVTLKHKKGPVREIAFSTRNPEDVMALILRRMNDAYSRFSLTTFESFDVEGADAVTADELKRELERQRVRRLP